MCKYCGLIWVISKESSLLNGGTTSNGCLEAKPQCVGEAMEKKTGIVWSFFEWNIKTFSLRMIYAMCADIMLMLEVTSE